MDMYASTRPVWPTFLDRYWFAFPALAAMLMALFVVFPLWGRHYIRPRLVFGGIPHELPSDARATARKVANAWSGMPVTLAVGDERVVRLREDLGFSLDEAALARAIAKSRDRAASSFFAWWRYAALDQVEEIRLPVDVDEEAFERAIALLEEEARRSRASAREDGHTETLVVIDRLEARSVLAPVRHGADFAVLPTHEVLTPPVLAEKAKNPAGSFDVMMAQHRSEFREAGRSWGRARNVKLAALSMDGQVIAPDGEFSYNEVLGARTYERGFMPALEVSNGEIVEGIGGGVCQVATGLHAVALLSGFEILEHYPHSRRLRYAAAGLDAAVVYGRKDLRIRNPYHFPVRIRATARDGVLEVRLQGAREGHRVEWWADDRGLVIERVRQVFRPGGVVVDKKTIRYLK